MNTSIDINKALREARPMIESLLYASDRMKSIMAVAALRSFLSTGSTERTLAFCIESWQAGRGWLSAAFENGFYDIGTSPESVRLPLVNIATPLCVYDVLDTDRL